MIQIYISQAAQIVLLVCISIFTGGLLMSNKNTVKTALDGGAISNYINSR